MLEGLIAGAASALIGTALGFRLKAGEPSWQQHFSQLESQVVMLKAATGGLAAKEELGSAISKATAECHSRAANIANQASAEVMEQLLVQLQSSISGCKEQLQQEFDAQLTAALEQLQQEIEQQDERLRALISAEVVEATAPLISREEVQRAFAQVAAIEAQRIAEQQDEAARAALQQARIQEVFGTRGPQVLAVDQQLGELNAQLNQQLGVLQQRLGQIRGSRPASPEEQLVDPGVG